MMILKLLSEEVFDFSKGELTAAKTKELKARLNDEFRQIHELCLFVLSTEASVRSSLVIAALSTLHAFLTWVPLGYIFESNVVHMLLNLLQKEAYRNLVMKCLTEVGSLALAEEHDAYFVEMFGATVRLVAAIIPPGTKISESYHSLGDSEQQFVQDLAGFLTSFFRVHLGAMERHALSSSSGGGGGVGVGVPLEETTLTRGLEYLLEISLVDEPEIFKLCIDYWHQLVLDLFSQAPALHGGRGLREQLTLLAGLGVGDGGMTTTTTSTMSTTTRMNIYPNILSHLRLVILAKMAKPEEVLLVEDENGNVVREELKDADVVALYKVMRETLVYLVHLNPKDTEEKMISRLRTLAAERKIILERVKAGEPVAVSWGALNRLCWAMGSISGTMKDEEESRFLVVVIKDLLDLTEKVSGKDNKAAIASNIMYVVGQYPRFLRQHWKFLRTVVNKLFEFMHERHPGVQDMACETFIKIASKCKRKFVVPPPGEPPFVETVISSMLEGGPASPIFDLEPRQIHLFYEAVGLMVGSASNPEEVSHYLQGLMRRPDEDWGTILEGAAQNPSVLSDSHVARKLADILRTNEAVCTTLGTAFLPQIRQQLASILHVYQHYSQLIASLVAENPIHARSAVVKAMRTVKKNTLRLIEKFIAACDKDQAVLEVMRSWSDQIYRSTDLQILSYGRYETMPDRRPYLTV